MVLCIMMRNILHTRTHQSETPLENAAENPSDIFSKNPLGK